MLKILHLAPLNFAGVPYSFYDMHNKCGDYSRILTFHKNERYFPEDVCLNLSLPNFPLAKVWRKNKLKAREASLHSQPIFKPKNSIEKYYFYLNDFFKKKRVNGIIEQYNLEDFDIIHYDGGLDLYRDASLAKKWKSLGKKIVCCYYGSDLRIRGIIKELDEISDLNLTSEFDHLELKEDLYYLFYPYDASELPKRQVSDKYVTTIVHSPTNRRYKGTETILSVIEKKKKKKKNKIHVT